MVNPGEEGRVGKLGHKPGMKLTTETDTVTTFKFVHYDSEKCLLRSLMHSLLYRALMHDGVEPWQVNGGAGESQPWSPFGSSRPLQIPLQCN